MALGIRPLVESDLDEADHIMRVAFGTALGMACPERFLGDAELVRTRYRADPAGALIAEHEGSPIGSSFANRWGSIGFLGPVTVHPAYWHKSVAKALISCTMEVFSRWGIANVGLYTFADSPKHVGLYQRFGFWPRSITAVMGAPVGASLAPKPRLLSALTPPECARTISAARSLADAVHPGLDLTREIESVRTQALGETVLIEDDDGLAGMAVCHIGAGTEAGTGNCYVKFGAVRPGTDARRRFVRLIEACQDLAAARELKYVLAGVNAEREQAWVALRDLGFRAHFQGVSMHRPNLPFYSVADSFVIDDWR